MKIKRFSATGIFVAMILILAVVTVGLTQFATPVYSQKIPVRTTIPQPSLNATARTLAQAETNGRVVVREELGSTFTAPSCKNAQKSCEWTESTGERCVRCCQSGTCSSWHCYPLAAPQ